MSLPDRLQAALRAFTSPYSAPTQGEADWQQAMESNVKQDVREFAQLSAAMLQDHRYAKLSARFQRILEQNIRLLIWYDVPSAQAGNLLEVYYEAMRKFQHQVRALSQIVETPKEFVVKAKELPKEQAPVAAKGYAGNGGKT